jgi:hypothetical protein
MKTTKGGKVMNPTDAYRKQIRKREIKRNKKERQKVREVGILKKDPEQIKDQIRKLDMSSKFYSTSSNNLYLQIEYVFFFS